MSLAAGASFLHSAALGFLMGSAAGVVPAARLNKAAMGGSVR